MQLAGRKRQLGRRTPRQKTAVSLAKTEAMKKVLTSKPQMQLEAGLSDQEPLEREELERKTVQAMQAKYPKLKECRALVKLGLTAADTVRACYIPFVKIAWSCVVLIGMCSLKFTCISCTLRRLQLYKKEQYCIEESATVVDVM